MKLRWCVSCGFVVCCLWMVDGGWLDVKVYYVVGREGKGKKYLLVAWISQLYIASIIRGLQSRNPAEIPSRTSLIDSPVNRPMSSSSPALDCTDRSSKNTATPCMGSWHRGPWPVASWKAYAILSLKSRTSSAWWLSPSICCLVSSTKLERIC